MQLTNTTDYAIRIVCYLAIKKRRVKTAKLASELKIPESYIPKITKQLKKEKIISASEGTSGGYAIAKNPEKIYLFDEFDIIKFNEVEKEGLTGLGNMKYWHIFNVIAKKK